MRQSVILLLLVLAALLEAAGDAFVRLGLRSSAAAPRLLFFLLLAQVISWLVFHQKPGAAVLIGGGFIALGGLIISLAA